MFRSTAFFVAIAIITIFVQPSFAQPAPADAGTSTVVTRMMAFDKNSDGKVSRDEMTDARLQDLFDRADANKDSSATKEEFTALAAAIQAEMGAGNTRGGRGGGGPGGREGRGPGGRGGPPQPGILIPPPLRDSLNLTVEQNKQLDDLQKEVDERLAKILTDAQKTQLQGMRGRGPGRGAPGL